MTKNLTLLLFPALIIAFFSCKKLNQVPIKNNQTTATSPLDGNWTIVNDSTTTDFWGLWANLPSTGTNYVGQTGDYYNFMSNGKLYRNEGTSADTSLYTLNKNNIIELLFYYPNSTIFNAQRTRHYAVSNLTAHTMTLKGDTAVSPETVYSHIINLKK